VNSQCPGFDLYRRLDPSDSSKTVGLLPNVEIGEQIGLDFSNRWELYASSRRAFFFLDGQPYACADLPAETPVRGNVTVSFGQALFHSGLDDVFQFQARQGLTVQTRHVDNLGYTSRVAEPAWDYSRFPCATVMHDN
jgi:hypothetical protein